MIAAIHNTADQMVISYANELTTAMTLDSMKNIALLCFNVAEIVHQEATARSSSQFVISVVEGILSTSIGMFNKPAEITQMHEMIISAFRLADELGTESAVRSADYDALA